MDSSIILIVDDDRDIREIITALLESEGFLTLQASNGQEAISLMSRNIDLIILDIMMPGDSGFTICEKIRRISAAPILYLSAKSLLQDKQLAFDTGGDDYLTKPFIPAELLTRVKAILRRYQIYKGKNNNSNNMKDFIKVNDLAVHPTSCLLYTSPSPRDCS